VSTYRLSGTQRVELERELGIPVLDRYNVVLQIFHRHARTKEAKLQVALAELPYLRSRLRGDLYVENQMKHSRARKGDDFFARRLEVLKERERGVRARLANLKDIRRLLRRGRESADLATVAVVGYTNCGKTSLIKALTASKTLKPKDKLFATLDVTVHETKMPESGLKTLLVDTVGFISDIPTALVASFSATLEDALSAHVVVHVRDVAHPDTDDQERNVIATLRSLGMPEAKLDAMVTVGK